MVKISDITEFLNKKFPEEAAEDFDNPGLLFGSYEGSVQTVLISLDATDDVTDHAARTGTDLIITHHPIIFSPIKRINDSDFLGKKLLTLGEYHIGVYSTHTNYDIYRMGHLAAKILSLKNSTPLDISFYEGEIPYGIGVIGTLDEDISLSKLCDRVKKSFGISFVREYGTEDKKVKKIAIVPGSGKSYIDKALLSGADVLITGDIDHHSGIDAVQKGIALIDAGHYGIEHIFIKDMANIIRCEFPELDVLEEDFKEPFKTV